MRGAGELDALAFATAKSYRPDRRAQRTRPLDPERAESHGRGRRRADGRLRQLRRLPADHRVRRCPVELVRPPQPRPLLGRRQARSPKSSTPIGRCTKCLLTTTKLVAPFVPFLAETLWQNLAGVFRQGTKSEERQVSNRPFTPRSSILAPESVHLADYPTGDPAAIDEALSARMNLVRLIASLGRNARNAAKLKVRQPLAKVEVILADTRTSRGSKSTRR